VREFRAADRAGIAHVAYPFRANETRGWLLVNGEPPLVTDAAQPIQVVSGQAFTLALESNRTTGYQWQLARPFDEAVVKSIRPQHRDVTTGRLGAWGEEL
jgi:predicted secreted protein